MSVSPTTVRALQRLTDTGGMLALLTISHSSITVPVRLVNDTRALVSNGLTFLPLPFAVTLPQDMSKEVPRAQLQMDNVGRDLTADLEALPPGAVLTATLAVVHRSTPNVIEYSFTAPLSGVRIDVTAVTATMGPADLLRRAAVQTRFDPVTSPGLFPE